MLQPTGTLLLRRAVHHRFGLYSSSREEFEKAHRSALAGSGDRGRQRRRADLNELAHGYRSL
jgi:hypothetical protein